MTILNEILSGQLCLLINIYLSFQFSASISENSLSSEILRIQALDADEEFSDNWLAEFFFISGNEDNYFEIVTDPATNQGILRVIKVWINTVVQTLNHIKIVLIVKKYEKLTALSVKYLK